MHDMAVALDHHQILDFDGPVVANAPEVVAAEIDKHDMFRALLLVSEKLLAEGMIFLLRFPARVLCLRWAVRSQPDR